MIWPFGLNGVVLNSSVKEIHNVVDFDRWEAWWLPMYIYILLKLFCCGLSLKWSELSPGETFSTEWEVKNYLSSLELHATIGVSLRLIYIVITSLCGFDIDSPTLMERIGQLSPTWVVCWTPFSSHGLCRL